MAPGGVWWISDATEELLTAAASAVPYDLLPESWLNHRLAATAAVLIALELVWLQARYTVGTSTSKHPVLAALRAIPFLHLGEPQPGLSSADLKMMHCMYLFVAGFYFSVLNPEGRPLARDPGALPIIRYRLEILLLSFVGQTMLYQASRHALRRYVRDEEQLENQAANVVRILVKCVLMVYCMAHGNWWKITFTHPSELRESDFENSYLGPTGMSCLYIWELLFRNLRPISFIHHGAALMGAWSAMEWLGDDLEGQSVRKFMAVGTTMSFTEGWCCLILLIGAMKGCSLRQWSYVMMGNCIGGCIIYNLIAVWWIACIWQNYDTMAWVHRTCSCPLVLLLTYPAQMYMITVFRGLSHSLARQADAAVGQCCTDPFIGAPTGDERQTEPTLVPSPPAACVPAPSAEAVYSRKHRRNRRKAGVIG